ncbi:thioredoxin reductase 1, cytoplasmic-like [Mizuhopecten yessoensis]|uniref:thioredoxin reductase 1, cytoplasmic-like n=1 Tax=Mizuhopecten yessoensis TaxID=6573 RepID=UPI000B45A110|nr:thioredoxin reductase 1, cytoplasmic-like [Mizuhopecten yessoensis]
MFAGSSMVEHCTNAVILLPVLLSNFPSLQIEKLEDGQPGKYKVYGKYSDGTEYSDTFNTVIFAIGRDPVTKTIGLDKVGVKLNKSGKVVANESEATNVSNIYAIGDILEGKLELTPVAIQAGKLLARRLYDNSKVLTDYVNVATTVFTPLEYGAIGYSEEAAIEKFGEDNVEVRSLN